MNQTPDLETRLLAVIAEVGLSLSEAQRCAYIADLVRSIPDNCTDAQLQRLILYYHEHHELVQSLRDVTHPHHWLAWTTWSKRVIAILRQRGLDWSHDIAVERHDLVQVALQALQGALAHYRYESAFSTWAYAVASHAVQNYLRGLQTIQRNGQPLSLEQLAATDKVPVAPAQVEAFVEGNVLHDLVTAALAIHPDPRARRIFWLYIEGYKLAEIGQRLQISTSRVSVLLTQIKQFLREHPELQCWDEGMKDNAKFNP